MIRGPYDTDSKLALDWKLRAACAGYPNTVFFPIADPLSELIDKAKAICAGCPVSQECLEYAFETNQVAGIWGGTTEEERKSLRRRWLTTRRRSG